MTQSWLCCSHIADKKSAKDGNVCAPNNFGAIFLQGVLCLDKKRAHNFIFKSSYKSTDIILKNVLKSK